MNKEIATKIQKAVDREDYKEWVEQQDPGILFHIYCAEVSNATVLQFNLPPWWSFDRRYIKAELERTRMKLDVLTEFLLKDEELIKRLKAAQLKLS
jgi:hypothetical protein